MATNLNAVEIRQLMPTDAAQVLEIMRASWNATYVEPGLGITAADVTENFPVTPQRVEQQARTIARQFEDDTTTSRYDGAFTMPDMATLAGFVKVARPLKAANRYSGTESVWQKFTRRAGFKVPLEDPELIEIMELRVSPEQQVKGIGTLLMREALNKLPSNIREVRAFTLQETVPFFERFGFIPSDEARNYPDSTRDDQVALTGLRLHIGSITH